MLFFWINTYVYMHIIKYAYYIYIYIHVRKCLNICLCDVRKKIQKDFFNLWFFHEVKSFHYISHKRVKIIVKVSESFNSLRPNSWYPFIYIYLILGCQIIITIFNASPKLLRSESKKNIISQFCDFPTSVRVFKSQGYTILADYTWSQLKYKRMASHTKKVLLSAKAIVVPLFMLKVLKSNRLSFSAIMNYLKLSYLSHCKSVKEHIYVPSTQIDSKLVERICHYCALQINTKAYNSSKERKLMLSLQF